MPAIFRTTRWASLWALTWPQVLMLLVQFGIGLTDVWAAGRIGPDVQASIGLIAQCHMVLMTIGIATANAAVAAVSQSIGAGRLRRAQRFTVLVVVTGMAAGLCMAYSGSHFRGEILRIMHTPAYLMESSDTFFRVYLWTLPGHYLVAIMAALLRAVRCVRLPLLITLVTGLLNIWGDLAFGLGWWGFPRCGAAGLAWATFVSVTLGALLLFGKLLSAGLLRQGSFPPLRWIRCGGSYLLRVGLPALGTAFLWQTGFVLVLVMTMTLPHESVNALAGLTAGMRIEAVIFLPAVACQMAVAVVVGQELGSGNREKAQQSASDMLLFAVLGMSLLTGCLWFIREELAAFMTDDSRVQAEAVRYLVFNFLSVPLMVANLVLIGVFTGAGANQYSMWSYLFSIWGVRLPLSWWLGHMVLKSSNGIYWAMVIAQIVQLGILMWIFFYTDWKRFSLFDSYRKK